MDRVYIAIDLKSFYASVECVQRGLDPMNANLVVADPERTEKTICLAVSPSLKRWGIPGRPRLFEVVQKVAEVNALRRQRLGPGGFSGSSTDGPTLEAHPELSLDYIVAKPRMALYMEVSARVYEIYLNYVAPEDIHVYSVDEVFLDVTHYLKARGLSPRELAMTMILDVLKQTGITATAGIGTNLYLCKVAMDIVAKHIPPDENGVRIAQLDEQSYRRELWTHRPLTDFWRVGPGYRKKLEGCGLRTMGDIARCSLGGPGDFHNEDLLYKLFGVGAELLIDHAWGYEPCTIAQIKAYRPATNSICSGQVLTQAYPCEKARLVLREMAEQLTLDLVEKSLVTRQLTVTVGYDVENLTRPEIHYTGPVVTDHYGRRIPKHSHGTVNLDRRMSSTRRIMEAVTELFDRIADPALLVRRMSLSANFLEREDAVAPGMEFQQLNLFADVQAQLREDAALERERCRQRAMLDIKRKYGKNAIFRGMDLEEGATTIARNGQIGGHKA